jgi:hypothetical protein
MNSSLASLRQWFYPAPFRVRPANDGAAAALLVSRLAELAQSLPPVSPATPRPEDREPAVPVVPGGLDDRFVIELCNHFHRMGRSVRSVGELGGGENEKLRRHIERFQKTLEHYSIQCQDLTGQRYDPGRSDFEPLGEAQPTAGLRWPTIIQCERPVVLIGARLIQRARGVVGDPVAG